MNSQTAAAYLPNFCIFAETVALSLLLRFNDTVQMFDWVC